jgi:hypothetical protein
MRTGMMNLDGMSPPSKVTVMNQVKWPIELTWCLIARRRSAGETAQRGIGVKKLITSACVLAIWLATSALAEDKACVTHQWYGALELADMERAIIYIYTNDSIPLSKMIEENKVGIFHGGTRVFIKERYITPRGNNLIRIRKIGTEIELWTHMAAVVCR